MVLINRQTYIKFANFVLNLCLVTLRRSIIYIIALLSSLTAFAQPGGSFITGAVLEEDGGQSVIQAGVQILSAKDSTMIDGTITNLDGVFRIRAKQGDYILKVSCLGYVTQFRNLHKTASVEDLDVGKILMPLETQSLKASVVAAKVAPMTIVADTVVYNAAAYRVADDAMLDELLAKIPGLEVSSSGTVTLHGKKVEELLVNGKRFFGGDVKTGIKNLSADMIENIKAYERESDFTRLTGIEDGEEVPVLDLTIKKNMLGGWRGNVNAGTGPADNVPFRYRARLNANKITKKDQTSIVAGVRNTSGKAGINTTSRSQLGYGSSGLSDYREAGASFSRQNKKLEVSGHAHYNGFNRCADYRSQSESVTATSSTFGAANTTQINRNDVVKADATIQYRPDNLHALYVRPVVNLTMTGAYTNPFSSSFNKDPLSLVPDPNEWVKFDFRGGHILDDDPLKSIRVNSSSNITSNYVTRFSGSLATYYTIRSPKKKSRSLTFRLDMATSPYSNDQFVDYFVYYYKKKAPNNTDARKQFISADELYWQIQPQVSCNLPLAKHLFLQGTLQYSHRVSTSTRNYYSLLQDYSEWTVDPTLDRSRQKQMLPAGYENSFDDAFSSSGRYVYQYLRTVLSLRYSKKKFNASAGVVLLPQWGNVTFQTQENRDGSDNSFVFNAAPTLTLKYNKAKTNQLSFTYRSWSSSPSLYNLLPVKSGTNPLSVHIGNSSLKPSFTHSLTLSYNFSNLRRQTSFVANAMLRMVQNASSTSTEYIPETGGRITMSKNIDGNWNASGNCVFNKTFSDNHFSMSNHAAAEYQNNVSYLYNSSSKVRADEINTMKRFMVKESLDFTYRNDILELIANAGGEYTDETSVLRPEMTQHPFAVKAGMTATLTFPWKTRVSADFSTLWQRGFMFDVLNRNYYYLNADISQTILKGKGTIRLDAYDLLNQSVNMTRSFGASSRSITTFNGVGRYVILTFVYRFKFK